MNLGTRAFLSIVLILLLLSGCSGEIEKVPVPTVTETQTLPTQEAETAAPTEASQPAAELLEKEVQAITSGIAAVPNPATVFASGELVKSNDQVTVDYSNTADGYVMVRYDQATDSRLKVILKGPETTYTYNLPPQQWTAFPLSDENGAYQLTVYKNVTGSKYAALLSLTVDVEMTDEFAPFLRSNQYVNFDSAPETVEKAKALAGNLSDPLEKVEAVYDFVVGGMTYDRELAANVTSGYLPELDLVLEKMRGICFDYAALMTGMLRSQGVPTKLVVGYAGEVYHAWISVWSEHTGWVQGVIFFDGTSWQRMDPTFASSGGSDILDYIGDGTNYTAKYFY